MEYNSPTPQTPPRKRPLPPFTPKTPMRINGSIPNRHANDISDVTLAPGCTLIIRGVGAAHRNTDPTKVVETAILKISKDHPDLADIPLSIKPFNTRGDWSTSCYVQLDSRKIPKSADESDASEPRVDLLEKWMIALANYDPKWNVAWTPAKHGSDKRMYVRFPDLNAESGDQGPPKEKLLQWAKAKGYPVCQSFANPGGIILSFANPSHVDHILSSPTHTIKGFTHPLRTLPARQVEILNVFEMIIMGVPTEYEEMDGLLEEWIDTNFADNGMSTMAGARIPPNEPETFVFHMISWADATKVLSKKFQEKFTEDFQKYGPSLLPPQLLFKINSEGFYKPRGNIRTDIQKGADTIDIAIKDLQRQFNDMKETNQQNQQANQLQLTTISSSLNNVTQTISHLENRIVGTQRALLAQSQEVGLSRNLSDINADIIRLQTRLLFEKDAHQCELITGLLKKAGEQQKHLEERIQNSSREFLTIVGGPIGQLQLPQATMTIPSPSQSTSQEPPLASHGAAPTASTSRRRAPGTINGATEEQNRPKKRRTDEDQMIIETGGPSTANKVRQIISHNSSTLTVTYGDNADSVKKDNTTPSYMNNVFRGVFDNLRGLSARHRSYPVFCRSTAANSKPNSFFLIGMFILALSLVQMVHATNPASSTSTLSIYALNANGLVKPVKLNHINNVIKTRCPQAFVIGETKTRSKLSKSLPFSDYEIYEEEGIPVENHHIFKWGIVVGVRKNTIQIVQRLQVTQQSLKGRVIAIDVILPTPNGGCIPHRIIGCYAPWNPGDASTDENRHFWNDLTELCRSTTTSWTLAGDLNATVAPFERHSGGAEARRQFLQFLRASNGRDLWTDNPDRTRLTDWTCRSKHEGHPAEGNIIDRVVTSQPTFIDAEIYVADKYDDWIPNTDHRGVVARITHSIPGNPQYNPEFLTTNFTRTASSSPRIKLPLKIDKHKYEIFRVTVDDLIDAKSIHERKITDDTSFIEQYKSLTEILTSAASEVFGHTKPYNPPRLDITNPKIKCIVANIRTIGGALRFERSKRTAQISPKAVKHHHDTLNASLSRGETDLIQTFSKQRKDLHKSLYAERAKEIVSRAKDADKRQIFMALKGSTKKMVQTVNYVPLPYALNDLDNPEKLICDPEGVKSTTREYFTRLYDHSRVRELPKPWLDTPSVTEVKNRIQDDGFQWPRKTTLPDFRAMLRRGNHRPSPGPDKWEKWTIKCLSDKALSLVLDLHNYEVLNSCFPGTIKDLWLTTVHKRGLQTDLKNWRGLAFSNFLANSPMTWLNQCLIRYSADKHILPDTQVAAQPGVQTRDLMSYLAGIKCWANRHKQTVYAIQRDQMKGFDYLSPDGFYDAIRAYGLPDDIIKLDTAAQANVRCFIHTAYGATDPITVNGVSKQGGPASPLKSTFTTSMGHYYLQDCLRKDKDALIISTSCSERGEPHLIEAEQKLLVAMVEATDDTYIFSKSIKSLVENTLIMERFQYAYGWQTQWMKSFAYILTPDTEKECPENVTFQSVSIGGIEVDPLAISEHTITLIKNDLVFLRTKVDNPTARFNELKDFIENFQFPSVIGRLPITLIRKIIAQNVISKCRALLSLQPVTPKDAEQLDSLIMRKVHEALGFPFLPSTSIATLPVAQHGFSFPSVSRINAGLSVEGLSRDLNHHIPAYRMMALLTRADWICEKCGCVNPLDGIGLQKDCIRQLKSIPASWIIAQKTMRSISLSLKETDQSYVPIGDVSLAHAINIFNHKISITNPELKINGTALRTLQRRGIKKISDVGKWLVNNDGTVTIHAYHQVFDKSWTLPASRNWTNITETLRDHLHIDDLLCGTTELAKPRHMRQNQNEEYIRNLVQVSGFNASKATDGRTWASDGSMIPASASIIDDKSITGAATGVKTLVMRVPGRNVSILQGEQLGLIIALVLAENSNPTNDQRQARLLTDHLNSVRLIEDSKTQISQIPRLRNMNGRSYYRWIIDLTQRSTLTIHYTPAHSNDDTLETQMNNEADCLASSSQRIFRELPELPPPTFHMNDFTFHSPIDGWIETNIPNYVNLHLTRLAVMSLSQGHSQRMSTWAHDRTPPPDYPYLNAVSAHSAVIQLYARSGQLATADILKKRNKLGDDKCRLGCDATESPRHLFIKCPKYQEWRDETMEEVLARTDLKTDTFKVVGETKENIMAAAKSLFIDSTIWPLHFSLYYLGQIPDINKLILDNADISVIQRQRLISHIAADWHMSSIRLAGRIFGDFQKRMAVLYDNPFILRTASQ